MPRYTEARAASAVGYDRNRSLAASPDVTRISPLAQFHADRFPAFADLGLSFLIEALRLFLADHVRDLLRQEEAEFLVVKIAVNPSVHLRHEGLFARDDQLL